MRFHSSLTGLSGASASKRPPTTDCCLRAKGVSSASWESPGGLAAGAGIDLMADDWPLTQCPPCSPVCRLVAHRIDPRNTATKLTTTTPAIPLSLPDLFSPCLPAYPILSSSHPWPSGPSRHSNHDSIFPSAPGTADESAARHPSEMQGRIARVADRGPPDASSQGHTVAAPSSGRGPYSAWTRIFTVPEGAPPAARRPECTSLCTSTWSIRLTGQLSRAG
jgi:hypothetical protein